MQARHQALVRRELLVEVEGFRHVAIAFSTVSTEGVSRCNKAAAHGVEAPCSATFLLLRVEFRIGVCTGVCHTNDVSPLEDPVGDFDSMITLMQRLHATGGRMLGASLDLTPDA